MGHLDGCALFRVGERFALGPCARAEAGGLDVVGTTTGDLPLTQKTFWLAAGATGRAEWDLLGSLVLEGDVGLIDRMMHDRFYFAPDGSSGYQVPHAGLEVEIGLGARFP